VRGFTPQNLSAVLRSLYSVLLVASLAPPSQLRTSSVTSREPHGLKANLSTIGGTCAMEPVQRASSRASLRASFRASLEKEIAVGNQCIAAAALQHKGRTLRAALNASS
jgi:hypothetical protein